MFRKLLQLACLFIGSLTVLAADIGVVTNIPSSYSTNSRIHLLVTNGVPTEVRFTYSLMCEEGTTGTIPLQPSATSGNVTLYTSDSLGNDVLPPIGTYQWSVVGKLGGADVTIVEPLNRAITAPLSTLAYGGNVNDWVADLAKPNYGVNGYINYRNNYTGWCSTNAGTIAAANPGAGTLALYNSDHAVLASGIYSNGLKRVTYSIRRPVAQVTGDFYVYVVTNDAETPNFLLTTPESDPNVYAYKKVSIADLPAGASVWTQQTFSREDGGLLVPDGVPYRLYFLRTKMVAGSNLIARRIDLREVDLVPATAAATLEGSVSPPVLDKYTLPTFTASLEVQTPSLPMVGFSMMKLHYRLQGESTWTTLEVPEQSPLVGQLQLPAPLPTGVYDYYFTAYPKGFNGETLSIATLPQLTSPTYNVSVAAMTVKTAYVSGAGADTNDGESWQTPLREIQTAIDRHASASTGLVVYVTNGTYRAIDTKGCHVRIESLTHPSLAVVDANRAGRAATLSTGVAGEPTGILVGLTLQSGEVQASDSKGGAGVYGGSLTNCIIRENRSLGTGGAAANADLHNCLIVQNLGQESIVSGGTVVNATIYSNQVTSATALTLVDTTGGNNILWQNLRGDELAPANDSADPLFVDAPNGDFHLWKSSPCENSGDDSLVSTTIDLEGAPRIQGGCVTRGALETMAEATLDVAPADQTLSGGASLCTYTVTASAPWTYVQPAVDWLNLSNPTEATFDCAVSPAPATLLEQRAAEITVNSYGVRKTVTIKQNPATTTITGGGLEDAVTGGNVNWQLAGDVLKAEGLEALGHTAWLRKEYNRGILKFDCAVMGTGVLSVYYGTDLQFAYTNTHAGTIELYIPATTNVVWEFARIANIASGSAQIGGISWTPVMDVTLSAPGGTVNPTQITVTNGLPYAVLPTPTYTAHVFSHWLLGDEIIRPETIVTQATNHVLRAVSLPITLSVEPATQAVPAEGGHFALTVTATNSVWSMQSKPNWVKFDNFQLPTGTNSQVELTYTVQAAPYDLLESRSGTVVLTAKGVTAQCKITQAPAQTVITLPGLSEDAVTGGTTVWQADGEGIIAKNLPEEGSSWIRQTFGRGVLEFDYQVQAGGTLYVEINGRRRLVATPQNGWQHQVFELTTTSTVVWQFIRETGDADASSAQLKNVVFAPSMIVTLDPAGGSVAPTTKSVVYGRTYGALPKPSRTSYLFNGWYNGAERVTASTPVTLTEDHTLTAQWAYYPTYEDEGGVYQSTCIVTNIPTDYSSLDAIHVVSPQEQPTAFCYMLMNGLPFNGKEINEIPLTRTANGLYCSANVRGQLPSDGTYWYWVKGTGETSLTPRLNLQRYQPLSTLKYSSTKDWTWRIWATTAAQSPIKAVIGAIHLYHRYSGWASTNTGLRSATIPAPGGMCLYNVANAIVCSPVYSNGLQTFSMRSDRPTQRDYPSPYMAVYVLTNDFTDAHCFSGDRPDVRNAAGHAMVDDTLESQIVQLGSFDREPLVPDGVPFRICIYREPNLGGTANAVTYRSELRDIVVTPVSTQVAITNVASASFIPPYPAQTAPFLTRAVAQNRWANWPAVALYPQLNYRVAGTSGAYATLDMQPVEEEMYQARVTVTNSVWNNTIFASSLPGVSLPPGLYDYYFSCQFSGFDSRTTNLVDHVLATESPVGQLLVSLSPAPYAKDNLWLATSDGAAVPLNSRYWVDADTVAFVLDSKAATTNGILKFRFATTNEVIGTAWNAGLPIGGPLFRTAVTNYWGENNENQSVPNGGIAQAGSNSPITVDLTDTTMVAIRFNFKNGKYQIANAVYQSFDEESVGTPGTFRDISTSGNASSIQTEMTGFEQDGTRPFALDTTNQVVDAFVPSTPAIEVNPWDTSVANTATNFHTEYFSVYRDSVAGYAGIVTSPIKDDEKVLSIYGVGRVIGDRYFDTLGSSSWLDSLYGLGRVSFDYSPTELFDPQTGALWNTKNYTSTEYTARATFTDLTTGLAPGSVSVMAYSDGQGSFYELRLSQIRQSSNLTIVKNRLGLYLWQNGVPTLLAEKLNEAGMGGSLSSTMNVAWTNSSTYMLDISISAGGKIEGRVRNKNAGAIGSPGWVVEATDTTRTSGTFGVYAYNCAPKASLRAFGGTANAEQGTSFNQDSWMALSTTDFQRRVPRLGLVVEAIPRSGGEISPGDSPGNILLELDSVSDFGIKKADLPAYLYANQFVRVRSTAAGVALDNLYVESFQGKAQNDQDGGWSAVCSWVTTNAVGSSQYLMEFDMRRADPTYAPEFAGEDKSPWATNIYQWLISPVMSNGLGRIDFQARATSGKPLVHVQYLPVDRTTASRLRENCPESFVNMDWKDVEGYPIVVSNTTKFATYTAYVNLTTNDLERLFGSDARYGFFRIAHVRTSDPTARVEIDNVYAYGNPPGNANTWRAYNGCFPDTMGTFPWAAGLGFDGSPVGVLNNSLKAQVEDGSEKFVQLGIAPYLRSAEMKAGVGCLSFVARICTNGVLRAEDVGGKAEFVIEAAPIADREIPEDRWHPIQVVNGTESNHAIASQFYQAYSFTYYEPTDHVLRIRMLPGSASGDFEDNSGRPYRSRLLLDNVLLEEPLRSSFVIDRVELNLRRAGKTFDTLPKGESDPEQQPLLSHPVTVDVRLGRRLLDPQDINVYFTWHRGTNDWGNWWRQLNESSDVTNLPENTTKLTPISEGRTYQATIDAIAQLRYSTNNVSDNVVQYCVWATYKTTDGMKVLVLQDQAYEPFTEFSWYWPKPAALSKIHRAWSPYFWIYTSRPGNTWFNEINMIDWFNFSGVDSAQYVEIVAPEGLDLRNWSVRQVNYEYVPAEGEAVGWTPPAGSIYTDVLIGSNVVGQALNTVVMNNAQDGWAFYTLGNAAGMPLDQPLPSDAFNTGGGMPYGLLLFRDNGAFEYGVTYCIEAGSIDGMHEMARLSQQGGDYRQPLIVAGFDPEAATSNVLAVTSGRGTNWVSNASPTPQNRNDSQELPEYENTTFAYVYSSITGLGTQNNTTASPISEPVLPGYQPSLYTYRAAPLHEITSIQVDGVEQGTDYGSTYSLQLPALTSTNDVHIAVVFKPKALDQVITNITATLPSDPDVPFAVKNESDTHMMVTVGLNTNGLERADINLFVSWKRADDLEHFSDWGTTNWLNGVITNDIAYIREHLEELNTYEYATGSDTFSAPDVIPTEAFNAGDTIQYCAWALITDRDTLQSFIVTASPSVFTQPEAYYPVDRNAEAQAVLGEDYWSPYFMVLPCKPKKAWFNEVNLIDSPSATNKLSQFIELCVREVEPFSLDGWKLEVTTASGNQQELTLSGSTVKSDRRVAKVGFFLIKSNEASDLGDSQQLMPEIPTDQGPVRLALYYPSGVLANAIIVTFDDAQSYDTLTDWPVTIPVAGVDSPLLDGSLGLENDESSERDWFDSDWTFFDNGWTPALQNINQRLDLTPREIYTVYLLPSDGGSMTFSNGEEVTETVYRWVEGTNVTVIYTASPGRNLARIITKVGNQTQTNTDCQGATVWTNSFVVTDTMSIQAVYSEPEAVEANTVVRSVLVTSSDPIAYELSPRQPLIDDTPTVTVTVNPNASINQIYLSWYVGTNVWGVSSNGWLKTTLDATAAVDLPNTIALTPAGNSTYFASNALPAVATPGEVVQYCVWGAYDGTKLFVQDAQRTYTAPNWYTPIESVELNRRYAGVTVESVVNGFSAYYYVYGSPVGQTWFNEVNVWDPIGGGGGEMDIEHSGFIELCTPATNFISAANGLHLGGWTIVEYRAELVDGTVQLIESGSGRTTLTNSLIVANGKSGRGFFTLADAVTTCTYDPFYGTNVFSQQLLSGTFDINDRHLHVFKLFRENGAYEAGIAFFLRGADYVAGVEELEQLLASDPLMVDAGDDYNGMPGSLQLLGKVGTPSAYWMATYNSWSPQDVNSSRVFAIDSQVLSSYPTIEALVEFLVSVAINVIDPRDPAITTELVNESVPITQGVAFSRTYQLPKWYRLTQGSNPAFSTSPANGTITVSVDAVEEDMNLEATLQLEPAMSQLLTTAPGGVDWTAFEAWLNKYAAFDRGAALSTDDLYLKYWMDLNPTIALTDTSIEIQTYEGDSLTTMLLANGSPVTKLNPPAALAVVTNATMQIDVPWRPFVYGPKVLPIQNGKTDVTLPATDDASLYYRAVLTNAPAGYYD